MEVTKFDLVKKALIEIGTSSYPGEKTNNKVIDYFKKAGFLNTKDDEIPWCSVFLNAICMGLDLPRSKNMGARSWLNIGKETKTPEMGDIAILWRESPTSWKGHVGIFIAETEKDIFLLGGNQNNEVNISKFSKEKVLSYRSLFN